MEVDADGASQMNSLKRCNSEPSINQVSEASPSSSFSASSDVSSSGSNQNMGHHLSEKGRRFSTSFVGLSMTLAKVPSRLDQIKLEECIGQSDREAAHEKEVQSAMLMSQSWDELCLDDGEAMITDMKRPKSFTEPLQVLTSLYPYASSPSPTRVGKQCFSPSLQQPVRNYTFTPSPGSSPTRQTCIRRSLSPIVLRPSPLSAVKRKAEADTTDRSQDSFSPAKKLRVNSSASGESSPERHRHHLLSSSSGVSCSNAEDAATSSDELASGGYEITAGHRYKGFLSSSVFSPHMIGSSFITDRAEDETAILPEAASESSESNEDSMTDITATMTS